MNAREVLERWRRSAENKSGDCVSEGQLSASSRRLKKMEKTAADAQSTRFECEAMLYAAQAEFPKTWPDRWDERDYHLALINVAVAAAKSMCSATEAVAVVTALDGVVDVQEKESGARCSRVRDAVNALLNRIASAMLFELARAVAATEDKKSQ